MASSAASPSSSSTQIRSGGTSQAEDRKRKQPHPPASAQALAKPRGLQAVDSESEADAVEEEKSIMCQAKRARMQLHPHSEVEPKQGKSSKGDRADATTRIQFPQHLHSDLLASNQLAYEPSGLVCTSKPVKEAESEEYGAFVFELSNRRIKFRVAKITPTKNGQFVTLWKRIGSGPIMPYDISDPVDLFVVSVRDGERFGQFVFPKAVLCAKGVLSKAGKGGKRAIRVYPPWVQAQSQQAKTSQTWQLKHFLNIPRNSKVDQDRVRKLFSC